MPSPDSRIIIAFDLYGTILSTSSISTELAAHFGEEKARSIATLWRRYQLEYSFRMNSMSLYKPFGEITLASLHHALAEHSVSLEQPEINSIMHAYDALLPYPEVASALSIVSSNPSLDAYIFSNGTRAMISASLSSPHFTNLSPSPSLVFKGIVSVDELPSGRRAYKPDPRVYQHLADSVGQSNMSNIWLISGNPFDIIGARAAGCNAAWIDREKTGWLDHLVDLIDCEGRPTVVAKGVDEAVKAIREWISGAETS